MKNVTEQQDELKMELTVLENTHNFTWNNEPIKATLESYSEKFAGLVVTADNLKNMEKDQKELGSIRVKLEKFRKETKKDMEKPVKAFEMQVSELQHIIAAVESPLKDQIDKYEQQRINDLRTEYTKEAKEIAVNIGLRDEYMFDFIIPSQWTMRTATRGKAIQAINESLNALLQKQTLEDTAKQQEQIKQIQIDMLCKNYSDTYSLNTPILPQDCAHETKDCNLMDLPSIIENFAKKRAEVENKVIEVVAPVIAAPPVQQPVSNTIIPKQFTDTIVTRITMRMSAEQLRRFDEFIKNINIEVIKREVR